MRHCQAIVLHQSLACGRGQEGTSKSAKEGGGGLVKWDEREKEVGFSKW